MLLASTARCDYCEKFLKQSASYLRVTKVRTTYAPNVITREIIAFCSAECYIESSETSEL